MARRQTAELDVVEEEPPVDRSSEPAAKKPRQQRTEAARPLRERLRRPVLAIVASLCLLAVIAALYELDEFLASDRHFVLAGNMYSHPNLTVEGVVHTPVEAILRVFTDDFGRSIYLIPLQQRRNSLRAIDWVKDATVSRRWPNRVALRIEERTPVAFVMLEGATPGSLTAALIDADGVIITPPAKTRFTLPALFGLTREQGLPARRARIRQVLGLIQEVKAWAGRISEIDAADPDNLKITYSMDSYAVRLMVGSERFEPRMRNFLTHYGEISRRLPSARTFDLRLDDRITALDGVKNVE